MFGCAGLDVRMENGVALLDEPMHGTPYFEQIGSLFDYYADDPVAITEVRTAALRKPKEIFYLPAFLLLGLVIWLQRRRIAKSVLS